MVGGEGLNYVWCELIVHHAFAAKSGGRQGGGPPKRRGEGIRRTGEKTNTLKISKQKRTPGRPFQKGVDAKTIGEPNQTPTL